MVAKESFGLFAFCWHEASYEVVSDGSQQDHQEDNLSLMDREKDRDWEGSISKGHCDIEIFSDQITPLLARAFADVFESGELL